MQWWFKKFCKGDKSLEEEEHSGQQSEGDNDQSRTIVEADPLNNYTRSCWRTQHRSFYGHLAFEADWKGEKAQLSESLVRWLKIKKIIILKCCLLLFYATTTNHFSIRLQRVLKSGISMTTGNNQLSGWTEKQLQSTSQSETCTRKGHGHCLVVCCPSEPLQPSESWQNHYTWEVCSANRWDALKMQCLQPALVNWKGPILPGHSAWAHITQPMLQKLSEFGYFCLTGYIHLTSRQPPTTSSSTSITFCRVNASTTSRMQKMLSKSSSNSEAQIFMLQE